MDLKQFIETNCPTTLAKVRELQMKHDNLSEYEIALIRHYSNNYLALNQQLRAGNPSEMNQLFEQFLNQTLDKLPDYQDVVLRGTGIPLKILEGYEKLVDSGNFTEKLAFTSTSVKLKHAYSFLKDAPKQKVLFYIVSKTGKDISAFSAHEEKEVLFKSRTQFKVIRVEKGNPHYTISLEEI